MQSSKTDAVDLIYKDAGNVASEEVKEQIRQELGLDKPFIVQYTTWLGNVLKGDMGMSYIMKKPVFSEFMKRLPDTIALTTSSIVVTFVVSVPLGILSAVKQNKLTDYIINNDYYEMMWSDVEHLEAMKNEIFDLFKMSFGAMWW